MSEQYEYILKTEHVSKRFGTLEVLKDINLSVKKGEVICIIGPSGAGKSTFLRSLNQLEKITSGKIFIRDELFLHREHDHTVDKLPHDLVSAFRSTLEEVLNADLILTVTDFADPDYEQHQKVVLNVLTELGVKDIPVINVYNKTDLVKDVPHNDRNNVYISVREGKGLDQLLQKIEEALSPRNVPIELRLSYSDGAKLSRINQFGENIEIEYLEDSMLIKCSFPEDKLHLIERS